jgi:hypothetical protein
MPIISSIRSIIIVLKRLLWEATGPSTTSASLLYEAGPLRRQGQQLVGGAETYWFDFIVYWFVWQTRVCISSRKNQGTDFRVHFLVGGGWYSTCVSKRVHVLSVIYRYRWHYMYYIFTLCDQSAYTPQISGYTSTMDVRNKNPIVSLVI